MKQLFVMTRATLNVMTMFYLKCSKLTIFAVDGNKTLFRELVEELYLFKKGTKYSAHKWRKTVSQVWAAL